MKKRISLLLAVFISSFIVAKAQETSLVSVDWLKENLDRDDLVLLHLGPEDAYKEKHIPGAQLVTRNDYTFNSEDEAQIYDLPSVDELTTFFESKGLNDGDTIVLYVGTEWISPLTRLYFTLDYLGYSKNTFILDGGLPLWEYEGGSVTSEIPNAKKGSFTPIPNPGLVVSIQTVKDNLESKKSNIVDARASVFYEGIQETMGKKGHIPGAKTIPYTSIVSEGPNGSYLVKSAKELQDLFTQQGLEKNKPIILYCHIGQQATLVYFATKILGYNAMLFDGSMHGWSHSSDNPVESE